LLVMDEQGMARHQARLEAVEEKAGE
jgi:hypothetical protein